MNPPDTTATVKPSRLRVRTRVRAPAVNCTAARTSSRTSTGSPLSTATRSRRLWAKSSSPRIAASVTAATSTSRPAWAARQLDHFVLDQGRVDVHDDEASAAASRAGEGDRDVDPVHVGLQRELAPQRQHVGTGDVELHGRDGVAREAAADRSMLAPWAAIRAVTAATALARRGAPRSTTAAGAAWGVVTGSRLEADVEVEGPGDGGDGLLQAVVVALGGRQQQGQREVAADHHLLDVEDLGAHVRDGVEARC